MNLKLNLKIIKNLVKKKNHENIVEIRKLIQNYDEIAKIQSTVGYR